MATLNDFLKQLERDGVAEEVIDDQWSLSLYRKDDQRERILRNACRKRVLALTTAAPIGREELLHEIVGFISSTRNKLRLKQTSLQIASQVIKEMHMTGEIVSEGNFTKIVAKGA